MRRLVNPPFFCTLLLAFLFHPATAQDDFRSLTKQFKNPGRKYGSAPLWVWNTDVDSGTISQMLREFKQNEFGGVFIHPRPGLITPYLSPQWLALCSYTLKEAKRLDLDVWIYDENSYPSGFGGGHVPDEMPSSYNQGQMLQLTKTTQLPDTAGSFFLCLKREGDRFIDITKTVDAEKNKTGKFYLYKKTFYHNSDWYGGFSYVDLLVKGVTEKFISVTMPAYEKIFGKDFGKSVPGVFSDEPNIEVQDEHSLRWTPDLFGIFRSKWGYDLVPNLPSLLEEVGDWKKVRHDYFSTLLVLFIERWSKPYYAFTQKKGLEWTGHYWEHAWPNPNWGPDNMAMYAWHQRPGIDMLFNQFNEASPGAQFGNIRSVKELASVANQLGKKRTLSETYGGAGWEITFKDLKRLGDWEFVLGVNTLNQHLSYMTLKGARKYDYPQSFSYQNPWWPSYGSLNKYFARLSLALSSGKQQNDILVLEPTTTTWMYFNYDKPKQFIRDIGIRFQGFLTRLEKAQVEYDLGSENIIRDHGSVRSGKFVVGERAYGTVVLPYGIENVEASTFSLLQAFGAAGGTILQFSSLRYIDGKPDKRLDAFYQTQSAGFARLDSLNTTVIQKRLQNKNLLVEIDEPVQGNLFHHQRQMKDGKLLFLANASLEQPVSGHVKAKGAALIRMDLFTGKNQLYPNQSKTVASVEAFFQLPPAGSLLLFIPDQKQQGIRQLPDPPKNWKELTAPTAIRPASGNTLMIDFCDLVLGGTILNDFHVYRATDTLFKHFGFANGNPWNTSVQFRDRTLARDTFSAGTGFTATYSFTVGEGVDLSSLKAVVERPQLWQVYLNGKRLSPRKGEWWLDRSMQVFTIGNEVQYGENKLALVAPKMTVHSEIEPAYLIGNFALQSAAKGWTLAPPAALTFGSWKEQGMPMYGQEVSYTKTINVSANRFYKVRLGRWEGTVAAVYVNGKRVGMIAYEPYELDISSYLKKGSNTVEVRVTGSLKNLLGPHHGKPAPGLVSPWHWRTATVYPAGKDYDTYPYGLLEDFHILAAAN
ncbi:glycosyl hydrolase [Flavisolibacter nicotianae]|uniref:glycosyl hydrolase n=1 Tax=Flavisolibacter nicotianae TaxID=2364882 RepID=UPI0013C3E7A4|nr:glycosyl hydrolase [Flavisolibacter nicotianae]